MKDKRKKVLSTFTDTLFSIVLVGITISTIYFSNIILDSPSLNVETIVKKKSSKVYDNNNHLIKQLTMEDYENVRYEDLPDVFINALISCEDVRYFMHEGIDLPRILSAIKNDVFSMSLKEGASTITQQLIKNMMLTNKKSIERKIQEAYLANHIEKLYSKKDILEFYCNYVCFDGINHGVQSASYKYFNKSVSDLTLPEAALLAGVVNAPSAFSPLLNPNGAMQRKNVVLHLMHKHGYISKEQEQKASEITIEDMVKPKQPVLDENTYPYQAYIDVVYQQIYEKTGYDPYVTPMEIHTYMDSSLQAMIDKMQEGSSEHLSFNNDLQQFAASVIHNETGTMVACFGGRNYTGQKLLNHAYNKQIQPASTIKVILDYALAFEYLHYNNMEVVQDVPTYYPNTHIEIHNVDHNYLGEITIADALGYSRNTSAILTLHEVVKKISMDKVVEYLKDIHMMDQGTFSYAYGLGGFAYGVTPTQLAAAYSMIARNGTYIEPLCVKSIQLLDGSEKKISFTPETKKVLSDTTCYLLSDVLKQVMDANYWSIRDCQPKNVQVYAKTGTSSFDDKMLQNYGFPSNASKDRWLASYTKDYTIAAWTGFDEYIKGEKTYFTTHNNDAHVVKKFTKIIYDKIAKRNQVFNRPDGLVEVNIVKGSDFLATPQVADNYIVKALYKEEDVPTTYFQEPIISENVVYDYFILDDQIHFVFNEYEKKSTYNQIFDYDKILNGKVIYIDIYENGLFKETIESEKITTYPLKNGYYHMELYYKYRNGLLDGPKTSLDFIYT